MAATVWKGYLTFGLISIPLRLFTAARSERIGFRQLHAKCHTRIKQQLHCPTCNETVARADLVKGYEYAKDQYVLVDDSEIKAIQPESADTMEILEFVSLNEVDPLYFDSSFFTVPEDAGQKAYQLLTETMQKSGYAAIAKLSMRQREYTAVIRPHNNGLALHTMHYPNEIREVAEYGRTNELEVNDAEVALAQQLVESLAAPFEPEKYSDQYQSRLQQMVDAKREGEQIVMSAAPKLAPVIDLMAALEKSLADKPKKKAPARAKQAQPTARPARRKAAKKALAN